MSGVTPYSSCAPPKETLKPVMTSSNIKTVSYLVQSCLNALKNFISGRIRFIFPTIGSIITHAMSLPISLKHFSKPLISLKASVCVCFATSAGTPAELGCPNVKAPDPALTSNASECP